jgi:hypothetical protein
MSAFKLKAINREGGTIDVEEFSADEEARMRRWALHHLTGSAYFVKVFEPDTNLLPVGEFWLTTTRWPKWNVPPGCAGRLKHELEYRAIERRP